MVGEKEKKVQDLLSKITMLELAYNKREIEIGNKEREMEEKDKEREREKKEHTSKMESLLEKTMNRMSELETTMKQTPAVETKPVDKKPAAPTATGATAASHVSESGEDETDDDDEESYYLTTPGGETVTCSFELIIYNFHTCETNQIGLMSTVLKHIDHCFLHQWVVLHESMIHLEI